jgi:hypothetical protein
MNATKGARAFRRNTSRRLDDEFGAALPAAAQPTPKMRFRPVDADVRLGLDFDESAAVLGLVDHGWPPSLTVTWPSVTNVTLLKKRVTLP